MKQQSQAAETQEATPHHLCRWRSNSSKGGFGSGRAVHHCCCAMLLLVSPTPRGGGRPVSKPSGTTQEPKPLGLPLKHGEIGRESYIPRGFELGPEAYRLLNHIVGRDPEPHLIQPPAMQGSLLSMHDKWPSNLCFKTSNEG